MADTGLGLSIEDKTFRERSRVMDRFPYHLSKTILLALLFVAYNGVISCIARFGHY